MKKNIHSLVVITAAFVLTCFTGKATMICTDPGPTQHYSKVSSIDLNEKKEFKKNEKTSETLTNSTFQLSEGTSKMLTASGSVPVKKPWTRYILVVIMGLVFIKYMIAERARILCNRRTKFVMIYYINYRCDPDTAKKWYEKYYRTMLRTEQYFTVFSWRDLVDAGDIERMQITFEEVKSAPVKKIFTKMPLENILKELYV